jgi:hypothetical protein
VGIRSSAQDAGWTLREAVWGVEERYLWRGSDAAREAAERAADAVAPLQRLIQTRVTWPVSDKLRERGHAARVGIATAAVVVAAGASTGGALLAERGDPAPISAPVASAAPADEPGAQLAGVAVDFAPAGAKALPETTVAAQAVSPAVPAEEAASPSETAWMFAEAFVAYEVGEADEATRATFAAVAGKPLAKALSADPPRLPSGQKVPRARVLNVVLGERTGKEIEASVSLARLRAASEVRITMRETPEGWRVIRVLG